MQKNDHYHELLKMWGLDPDYIKHIHKQTGFEPKAFGGMEAWQKYAENYQTAIKMSGLCFWGMFAAWNPIMMDRILEKMAEIKDIGRKKE